MRRESWNRLATIYALIFGAALIMLAVLSIEVTPAIFFAFFMFYLVLHFKADWKDDPEQRSRSNEAAIRTLRGRVTMLEEKFDGLHRTWVQEQRRKRRAAAENPYDAGVPRRKNR